MTVWGIYTRLGCNQIAILCVVSSVWLEIRVETAVSVLYVWVFPRRLCTIFSACCIFSFCFRRKTIALDVFGLSGKYFEEEIRTPSTERICLFPCNADNRVVIVCRVAEVIAKVHLVIRVWKIIYPACRIRIDIDDVRIEEVPRSG